MSEISLETLAGGALQEMFDNALDKVKMNLVDVNTPYRNKREITIKVSVTQNEARDNTTVDVSVNTKLAPASPVRTQFAIGKDYKTGKVYAQEYGPGIKGQMSLSFDDAHASESNNGAVEENTENKVVDLRAAKKA